MKNESLIFHTIRDHPSFPNTLICSKDYPNANGSISVSKNGHFESD